MKNKCLYTILKAVCLLAIFFLPALQVYSQAVTEVITDFNGYWRSSASSLNSVKPNNSHNLLAFSFNGTRFSTGANDAVLANRGLSYIACDFRAIPLKNVSGTINGNTKIGLGAMYDGVASGPSNPPPARNLQQYLNDGIKGLDLGTGVANFPSGTLTFSVTNLNMSSVGDGFPDILITQFADPSGVTDKYEFIDSNGVRVGNAVDIILSNIPSIGTWTADFYEASTNPMVLGSSFIATDRNLRLWAADFSTFGVTPGNISRISGFRITTSGNSDLAFVAYNYNTFQVGLDHEELKLKATSKNDKVVLEIKGDCAPEVKQLDIERSTNAVDFRTLHTVPIPMQSRDRFTLDNLNTNGNVYYRLKVTFADGQINYKNIVRVEAKTDVNVVKTVYPNPARNTVRMVHEQIRSKSFVNLYNSYGQLRHSVEIKRHSTATELDLTSFEPGNYVIRITANEKTESTTLLIVK